MRRVILTIGLLVIIAGFYVVQHGAQVMTPVAQAFGLVTYTQHQTAIIAPTAISVPPSNYSFLNANLESGVQVRGSLQVGDGREVAFYVMNEGNFSLWRTGHPSSIVLAQPMAISSNFTFAPSSGGTYYFIFDNQDSSRRVVFFALDTVQNTVVLDPIIEYAGYLLFIVGIVLVAVGAKTGKRKKPPVQEPPAVVENIGWQCRFCSAQNTSEEAFCEKCGRART
jgi:uncharacterized membrane protein